MRYAILALAILLAGDITARALDRDTYYLVLSEAKKMFVSKEEIAELEARVKALEARP